MELIIAIFIVGGWYAYKYFQKSNEPAVLANVEVEIEEKKSLRNKPTSLKNKTTDTCNFCEGEDIYIGSTKEKMPCPKCKRGMKIS